MDVGGTEGYKAALVQHIFKKKVISCDLSEEACKRANEIYGIDAQSQDIHNLKFKDNEFDIVLASETLEHVTDLEKAINEMLRVARIGIIITVPHETEEVVESNIKGKNPHSHIHYFDSKSFDHLKKKDYTITAIKMLNPYLKVLMHLVDANKIRYNKRMRYSKIIISMYNFFVPILNFIFGINAAIRLIKLDEYLSKKFNYYEGNLFIIIEEKGKIMGRSKRIISPRKIIEFVVPYHKLKNGKK